VRITSQSEAQGAWSRRPADAGQIVRPYSKGQKNDFRDAEAMQRPTMKFVTTKTAKQLNLQALHVCASD
jgi:hypothetical protein